MKRFVVPALIAAVVVAELVLSFVGPMPFVRKPTLLVANPFGYGIEDAELDDLFTHLQQVAARSRRFRVIPHNLIENYFLEREDDPDFTLDRRMSYVEYRAIAGDLEIEQLLICTAAPGAETVNLTLVLRDVESGAVTHRFRYASPSLDAFFAGEGVRTEPVDDDAEATGVPGDGVDPAKDLRVQTSGVEAPLYLFAVWLAGHLALAVMLAVVRTRRRVDVPVQLLLLIGLLMFLFSFFYAQNADMDYVQRFIAERGQISLAEDTATEQLRGVLRYLPLVLFDVGLYVAVRVGRRRERLGASEWGLLCAFGSAILYTLAFPSFVALAGVPVLVWVALVPLLLAVRGAGVGRGALYVIAFGALSSLLLNYWHSTYSYISLAFSVGIATVFYVLFAVPFAVLIKRAGRWGFLLAPTLWVVFEYLRSIGFIGYPWGLIGVSQYSATPIIQIADLTGVWGVSFVVVLVNAAIAWSIGHGSAAKRVWPRMWTPMITAGLVVAVALGYGWVRLAAPAPEPATRMTVVLVQQNTDPRKHDYDLSFQTLMDLTDAALDRAASAGPARKVDLVVWPEGGFKSDIRYWLDRPRSRHSSVKRVIALFDYAAEIDTWLLTGTQDHTYRTDATGEAVRRNFNSSAFFAPGGELVEIYHKMHLVPFTEHFPFQEQYPQLTELLDKFDTSNWKQGEQRVIFEHPMARFFTPICFEDIFPNDIRRFVGRGADLIVNITNDYWALTPVEGMQHAAHALFRAVENRRPMVRSTCSGFTTFVTARGEIVDSAPFYQEASITVSVPIAARGYTVYTRFGDWFPWLCGVALVAAVVTVAAGAARRRRHLR